MEAPVELSELMARIRASANVPDRIVAPPGEPLHRPVEVALPERLSTPAAPAVFPAAGNDREALELALAEAASMLSRARQKTEVSAAVPKLLRSLYRNQGGFNGILIEVTERLLNANRQLERENFRLHERLVALETAVSRQQDWTTAAGRSLDQARDWMQAIETYLLENVASKKNRERQRRKQHEQSPEAGRGAAAGAGSNEHDPDAFEQIQAQLETVEGHANRLGDHLKNLQVQVDEQTELSQDWHAHYRQATAHYELLEQNARRLEERQHIDASYFKNQLWFLQRLVEPLLAKEPPAGVAAGTLSGVSTRDGTPPATAEHGLDALYLAFEEAMRGNRNEIKERTRIYLPYVAAANAGTAKRPVLDLGCGRGEWLEVLGEDGYVASGVDLNSCMVEVCRERALPVTFANALDHLRGLPDASCGAVTAFHLIEHLPIPVLVPFLRDCRRVLQPGGVAIFETPNPYNVLVGSGYFYHDFTHQRPLPPTSTKFLVEQMGFSRVEIVPLNPWDEAAKVHGEGAAALEWRFNELFYGPQDYALIATP